MARSVSSQYKLLYNISLTAEQNVDPPVKTKSQFQDSQEAWFHKALLRMHGLEKDNPGTS